MTESELIAEILGSDVATVAFKIVGIAMLYVAFLLFLIMCFDNFTSWWENKHFLKEYLKKHRFEHFRVEPFVDGTYVVVEDMGTDGSPLAITYCNNFHNANLMCDVLNCDFLGECYSERKRKKLSSCSEQFTNKILKTTENGGEKE